jgi:putative lipoprotein (rSAM/lipoprotein system)
MSKLNRSFLKKINAILIALLGFFGFSSCEQVRLEYGAPMPEFAIKGQVTNVEDGKPIEGVRIGRSRSAFIPEYGAPSRDYDPNLPPPALSNKDGNYRKFVNDTIGGVELHFWDVDHVFRDTTVVVRFEKGKKVADFDIALTPRTEE